MALSGNIFSLIIMFLAQRIKSKELNKVGKAFDLNVFFLI